MKFILGLILSAITFTATAADIFPIRNDIGIKTKTSTEKVAIFYIDNSRFDNDLVYSVMISKWNQDGEQKTDELITNSPIVKVPKGSRVPVKLIFKGQRTEVQQTFRVLFLQETANQSNGVNIHPGFNIPVFIEPTVPKKTNIVYEEKDGMYVIRNTGNETFKFKSNEELKPIISRNKQSFKYFYILPNSDIKINNKKDFNTVKEIIEKQ